MSIPYEGPRDADGVPLTAYCQEVKAFVRANPWVNAEGWAEDSEALRARETRVCAVCGTSFECRAADGGRKRYCNPCSRKVRVERSRAWNAAKRAEKGRAS